MRTVQVVPYDRGWPEAFDSVRDELLGACDAAWAEIHHVGSTSVPGLAAKPIIDVPAVTPDFALVERATRGLVDLGYDARGEYGIEGRLYFSRSPGPRLQAHLHVYEFGHEQIHRHLLFRDYLRAHSDAARRYGELKKRLAAELPTDRDAYQVAKRSLIDQLQIEAQEWDGNAP